MEDTEGAGVPLDAEKSDDFEEEERDLHLHGPTVLPATSKAASSEDSSDASEEVRSLHKSSDESLNLHGLN